MNCKKKTAEVWAPNTLYNNLGFHSNWLFMIPVFVSAAIQEDYC